MIEVKNDLADNVVGLSEIAGRLRDGADADIDPLAAIETYGDGWRLHFTERQRITDEPPAQVFHFQLAVPRHLPAPSLDAYIERMVGELNRSYREVKGDG